MKIVTLNFKILRKWIRSIEKPAILSNRFDTKKKEISRILYRLRTLYTKEPVTTFDRDFWSLGHGKVSPHGVYDSQQNRGYITLRNSKNTSEFACESLKKWQGKLI